MVVLKTILGVSIEFPVRQILFKMLMGRVINIFMHENLKNIENPSLATRSETVPGSRLCGGYPPPLLSTLGFRTS